jgi:hypothetical protein
MLQPEAVASLTAALTDYANGSYETLPAPQFQVISQYAPKNGPKTLDFNLIHESVWRRWDSDRQLPDQVGLHEFTDLLSTTGSQWLPRHQRQPQFTVIGFTLTYDEPLESADSHEPGGGSAPVGEPTRVVVAADVDGRRYHVVRAAGQPAGTAQVSEPGTPLPADPTDPPAQNRRAALYALTRLVDIATATTDPQHNTSDGTDGPDLGVLMPGELVTVTGDRWDDDERQQLWVVVDYLDQYTIAVLGGDGYQWSGIPRGELAVAAPQWIRRIIRHDNTYGYIGADTTMPVLLDDMFHQRHPGCYQLTRVYRVAGQMLRVRVDRDVHAEQSRAEAHILNPPGGYTTVAATPWTAWWAATPPSAATGEALHPVAEQLLRRALRILTPPPDPTPSSAGT